MSAITIHAGRVPDQAAQRYFGAPCEIVRTISAGREQRLKLDGTFEIVARELRQSEEFYTPPLRGLRDHTSEGAESKPWDGGL